MDTNKFDYFVAKYRAAEASELIELGARTTSLAEEAEAALRQVAGERALVLQEQQQTPTTSRDQKKAARELEEKSYSPARAEIIHVRKVRLLWSFPLAFCAGFAYQSAAESVKGTIMGPPIALLGLFGFVYPIYCVYKLSRAVDPKRSVAWAMVAACFTPVIGWLALISLVLKAGRIRKAARRRAGIQKPNPLFNRTCLRQAG
jgi:hypothetical protein